MGLTETSPGSEFYDRWTELFHRGFGPVFQAGMVKTGDPPREDPVGSVLALAQRAGLVDGDRILDAGCGIAGPAVIIAANYPAVTVDGVTNSPEQVVIARERVAAAGLLDRVRIHLADYQALPFPDRVFDQVFFLESTGYATNLDLTYREAHRALRPGGRLYVKDVFCDPDGLADGGEERLQEFDRLWGCVRSKTMAESAEAMTAAGFEVDRAAPIPEIGTALLAGSMFLFDPERGVRPSELGESFLPRGFDPPILFGEIRGVKPPAAG